MIIMVACALVQHSPILGQAASSQTVCRLCSRTTARVAAYSRETGALTRIQSGLRRISWSGRWAFSGWRGREAVDHDGHGPDIECAAALKSSIPDAAAMLWAICGLYLPGRCQEGRYQKGAFNGHPPCRRAAPQLIRAVHARTRRYRPPPAPPPRRPSCRRGPLSAWRRVGHRDFAAGEFQCVVAGAAICRRPAERLWSAAAAPSGSTV